MQEFLREHPHFNEIPHIHQKSLWLKWITPRIGPISHHPYLIHHVIHNLYQYQEEPLSSVPPHLQIDPSKRTPYSLEFLAGRAVYKYSYEATGIYRTACTIAIPDSSKETRIFASYQAFIEETRRREIEAISYHKEVKKNLENDPAYYTVFLHNLLPSTSWHISEWKKTGELPPLKFPTLKEKEKEYCDVFIVGRPFQQTNIHNFCPTCFVELRHIYRRRGAGPLYIQRTQKTHPTHLLQPTSHSALYRKHEYFIPYLYERLTGEQQRYREKYYWLSPYPVHTAYQSLVRPLLRVLRPSATPLTWRSFQRARNDIRLSIQCLSVIAESYVRNWITEQQNHRVFVNVHRPKRSLEVCSAPLLLVVVPHRPSAQIFFHHLEAQALAHKIPFKFPKKFRRTREEHYVQKYGKTKGVFDSCDPADSSDEEEGSRPEEVNLTVSSFDPLDCKRFHPRYTYKTSSGPHLSDFGSTRCSLNRRAKPFLNSDRLYDFPDHTSQYLEILRVRRGTIPKLVSYFDDLY